MPEQTIDGANREEVGCVDHSESDTRNFRVSEFTNSDFQYIQSFTYSSLSSKTDSGGRLRASVHEREFSSSLTIEY